MKFCVNMKFNSERINFHKKNPIMKIMVSTFSSLKFILIQFEFH